MKLVLFFSRYSEPCKELFKTHPQFLTQDMSICVDSEESRSLLEKLKIISVPTLVVLGPRGEIMFRYEGKDAIVAYVSHFAFEARKVSEPASFN